jgi:predicted HTH transcriptional regulator
MSPDRTQDFLASLVHELCRLPRETEWVEFKHNDAEPEEIGEYISALANSAALVGKASAYLVWGVRDSDHAIVGTTFSPRATKVGNEELENWLLHLLAPKIHFQFFEVAVEDQPIVVLEIERAFRHPVQFKSHEFVRVGSYKKPLKKHPEKERDLWRIFDQTPFEAGIAKEHACAEDDAVHPMVGCPQSRPIHLMSSRRFESLRDRLFNSSCKWPILYEYPYLMGT